MQFWLDSVKYGNMQISSHIDGFWLDNSLQISPDEQLGFVKRLYFQKLPFHDRPQRLVQQVMLMENTSKYKLSYKTGWGIAGGRSIGWIVGWEEENRHPYFFVLNFETTDTTADIAAIRNRIFRGIMQKEGFFEGRK
jgi:beta-lactamase class D